MKLEDENGMEDKFNLERLKEILNPDGKGCGIQMAYISSL